MKRICSITTILFSLVLLFSCSPEKSKTKQPTFSWDNATVYFVYVDRFVNGSTENDVNYGRIVDYGTDYKNTATFHGGDLIGLTQKLREGYFTDLGINAIWVTGVYEQIHGWVGGGSKNDFPHYAYHGYYPMDFTMIDKNYGTIEEFRTFVDLAHEQGIRIIMDVGLNHPGYNTLLDAVQYNFGGVKLNEAEAAKHIDKLYEGKDLPHYKIYGYLRHFDFENDSVWDNWWGYDWIRTADEVDKDVLTESIFGLPDFKTEKTEAVKLPPLLKNKWAMEGDDFQPWVNPSAVKYRKDMDLAPTDYVIKWISAWVEEFGIDGFRCDVVENIEMFRWKQLNEECNAALATYRKNNPEKAASKWTDGVWMTGDIWDSGIEYRPDCADAGYASIVNFTFPKDGSLDSIGEVWQEYADYLNTRDDWNTLTYLNYTYKRDVDINNMIDNGTTLLLSPGAIQIFYGDEVARPVGAGFQTSDPAQGYRGDMIWGENQDVLVHWQKLGKFRNNHLSVGAGKQIDLGDNTYARTYEKDGITDKVVVKLSNEAISTVNVAGIFEDETKVRNAYTGEEKFVKAGTVEFSANNKVILVEGVDN
jgi:glycosidase